MRVTRYVYTSYHTVKTDITSLYVFFALCINNLLFLYFMYKYIILMWILMEENKSAPGGILVNGAPAGAL